MRSSLLLAAILLLSCQPAERAAPAADPNAAAPAPSAPAAAVPSSPTFTGKLWTRTEPAEPLGTLRIFLTDGTLLMDSCWETYRLARWRQEGADTIVWDEDGQEIRAAILAATDDELRLRLELVSGAVEEQYRLADAPFVCPDMPR